MKMMMKKNVEVVAQAAQIDVSEYSDSRKFVQRTLQTHSCWLTMTVMMVIISIICN